MKKLPKISIITPSFNQGNFLEETILSIISQDYSNYELIIIDAASKDNTLEVIRKYQHYIAYWVSEPDRGQSHAIQKGLEKATGDIINWINSDDLLSPGALQEIANNFNTEKYDVFCGRCDYFLNNISQLNKRDERMGVFSTVGETLLRCHINQPSTFFKASVFKTLGVNEEFHYTMDVDLWYRYILSAGQQRVYLSDTLLTYFRLHDASKTVADYARFEGDRHKIDYNILYSLKQPGVLLSYMGSKVPNFPNFKPTEYAINIPYSEIESYIHMHAWLALIHYNELKQFKSARECLIIAFRSKKTITLDIVKQIAKQYCINIFK